MIPTGIPRLQAVGGSDKRRQKLSHIILSIKNGEMHLIAEDMENLHIH